jgi:hypothetical protein
MLRVESCKATAAKWLSCLRDGTNEHRISIEYLYKELKAGSLVPEDIGTSDAEIEMLRVESCKKVV